MTDPLLTIEDATREFRVSPKTIRRRLTSGEIDGAYKRPGNRGPEWVMPRDSLEAAGFTPRALATPVTLPSDAEERAAYWERRAVDAEAALRSTAGSPPASRPRPHLGALGWAFIGVSVLIALIAGFVVLSGGDADEDAAAPTASGAMSLVVELLERTTEPGDAIGLVGERRTDALPAGRVAAASPRAGWDSSAGPRFVVAAFDDSAAPASVRTLRASSEVLLRAPHNGMFVEVYDRRVPARSDAADVASPAPEAPGVPEDAEGTPEPPVTEPAAPAAEEPTTPVEPGPAAPTTVVEPAPSTPAPSTPAADAVAPTPGEVQVSPGESFWAVAEDVVISELGPDAPVSAVTAYWSTLMDANADRLVQPGNADLLHVGQTIVLPPLA